MGYTQIVFGLGFAFMVCFVLLACYLVDNEDDDEIRFNKKKK